jgi:glycosyltransferase involved in cell wall biosynthesis
MRRDEGKVSGEMKKQTKKNKKAKLTVIRTIESFYPVMSGPANQAFRISKELEKRGVCSPILTSNYQAERSPKHQRLRGVEVFRFPVRWRFMKYFHTPKIKKAIERSRADIICAHSYRSYQTEAAYKMAKREEKPFVLHNHGSLIGYRSFVKGWKRLPYVAYDLFHRNIALKADAVIVNTKQEYNEAVRFGVDRKRIHIIPFGIDASRYRPYKKKGGTLNLLWVGRVTRDRNIEVILKAVKLLEKRDVRLRIVGNESKRTHTDKGSEIKRLKSMVKTLGIGDKVEFIPWTDARANKEFRKADIFVYTSLWENLGQTILEAAAAGLPLICTRVGVALELVEKGKTGKLVGFDKPGDIVKGVKEFIQQKRRTKASKLLQDKVCKEYSWNLIIERYIKIYREL